MHSEGPLLLFDGHCRFCNGWVRFALRFERSPRCRFLALQSPLAAQWLQPFGYPAEDLSSVLLIDQGRLYTRSAAVLRLLGELRPPWPWLAFLGRLPRPWLDAAYDFIGRHRYRLFGQSSYCMAASPAVRHRFLDLSPKSP
ncbi:MAG: thiol-disulfide oxidoreductase DCC family protein [Oceanococcaceae bacterium]